MFKTDPRKKINWAFAS